MVILLYEVIKVGEIMFGEIKLVYILYNDKYL